MDKKDLAGLAAGSFAVLSQLKIWRSGRNGNQSLWDFLLHHSTLNEKDSLWLKEEELNVLEELAQMEPESRRSLIEEFSGGPSPSTKVEENPGSKACVEVGSETGSPPSKTCVECGSEVEEIDTPGGTRYRCPTCNKFVKVD